MNKNQATPTDKSPREIEWTAVDITDHVQRFKLDGDELFIEKVAYLAVKQELETVKINLNYHVENYQGVCKELEASRLQIKDLTSALEDLINHGYLHAGEKAKETLKKWKQK